MSEENEFSSRHDYEESELFPAGNAPKPLFPQTETPSVKPLFGSSAEPETAYRAPLEPERSESVEAVLPANDSFGEIRETPSEETVYQPDPAAPEFREPVIVSRSEPVERTEIPPVTPAPVVSAPAMTEKAPENTRYAAKGPAPVSPDSPAVRFGQVRERFPIIPPGRKEEKKRSLAIDLDSASLGSIMKAARDQAGFSVQQTADASRIKMMYIKALESDDFQSLPKGIFPNAYVRTLCDLYCLNDEVREAALRKVSENLEKMDIVPTELLQQIDQKVQKNEQEEKRITKIFYATVIGASLLLLLLVTGIVMAAVSFRKSDSAAPVRTETKTEQTAEMPRTSPVETFDVQKLESLTSRQIPFLMQELSVPEQ